MVGRNEAARAIARIREELRSVIGLAEPGVAAVVASGGEPIAAATVGLTSLETREPISLATPFDTGSIAKIVTGLAVAILEEEGDLSPSMPVRATLPELPAYADPLRVWHLIHQESGLRSYFSLLYYMAGWHPRSSPTSREVFDSICRAGSLAFAPGSRYAYSDSNYFLLAKIVERIAGQPFGAFVRRRILDPLGMDDSHLTDVGQSARKAEGYVLYPIHARGEASVASGFSPVQLAYEHVGAEGFCASARDLCRLAGHIVLPTLVSATTMRGRVLRAYRTRGDGFGYGYGLNVGTYRGRRFVGHDGQIWGYSASLAVFPDDNLEIVCLSNREDLGAWSVRSAVLDVLEGKHVRPLVAHREPPRARRLVARYLDPTTARLLEMVEQQRGVQAVSIEGGEPIPVDAQEDGTLRGAGLTLAASCACGGHPSLLVREGDGQPCGFVPFLDPRRREAFDDYAGAYTCDELRTTFDVEAVETGIRLTNRDAQRPSMNLDYGPTIRDFFRSDDPYPGLSQLHFLRERDTVVAFTYRDPDGDRREDLRFVREPDLPR
jgi:CubicO group peptidase (beta-lactamase class C family)